MPPSSRGFFRPRERSLILLVLATFVFVCIGSIFFLPDRPSSDRVGGGMDLSSGMVAPPRSAAASDPGGKVYKVYKELREAGREFIIPPPPLEQADNPNVRHGVIDRPDPHRVDDRARLMAQVELDSAVEELRRKQQQSQGQQVLQKPNLRPEGDAAGGAGRRSSSSTPSSPPRQAGGQVKTIGVPAGGGNRRKSWSGGTGTGGGDDLRVPVVQGGEDPDPEVRQKRDKVAAMMKHAWDGYAKYAWGKNEVKPISKRGHSASIFGSSSMGATIVDGLDTLFIMGFTEEFEQGREWVNEYLDMNHMGGDVSVFETNIRYVGGLLSAYALTGDDLFKEKAVHVAQKLLPAFDSPTGIPYALINMRTGTAKNFGWASGGSSILSELGTLHMEFAYLSDITGDPTYVRKVERIREVLISSDRPKSLYPNYLNPKTGKWGQAHTSMGALGDSFYEYLLKEWLRSGKRDLQAKSLFDAAALDIERQLVKTSASGLTYFAEYKYGRLEHKMDHLACFGGGMYGLAAHEERDENSDRWMRIADGITNTCHESYDRSDTKLGPEAFRFTDSVEARAVKSNERYYILRPETFESYFVMWRLTHDQKYRDWGWEAVQALEEHCKMAAGYTGVKDVYNVDSQKDDVQQSFFLAETLKYLYLLFSDDSLISLDEWVMNTEAHPLPIRGVNAFYRPASGVRPAAALTAEEEEEEDEDDDAANKVFNVEVNGNRV